MRYGRVRADRANSSNPTSEPGGDGVSLPSPALSPFLERARPEKAEADSRKSPGRRGRSPAARGVAATMAG